MCGNGKRHNNENRPKTKNILNVWHSRESWNLKYISAHNTSDFYAGIRNANIFPHSACTNRPYVKAILLERISVGISLNVLFSL